MPLPSVTLCVYASHRRLVVKGRTSKFALAIPNPNLTKIGDDFYLVKACRTTHCRAP